MAKRNPDEDYRRLEREALAGDSSARIKILRDKLRTGKLHPQNVLFLLAGFLGDLAVRTVAKGEGIKETWGLLAPEEKFPKMLAKRMIRLTGHETAQQRLDKIAGITSLVYPFIEPYLTDGRRKSALNVFLQEYRSNKATGLMFSNMYDIYARRYQTAFPYERTQPVNFIFWALRNVGTPETALEDSRRNLWSSYLEEAGNVLMYHGEQSMAPVRTRAEIYQRFENVISRNLYTWGIDLPATTELVDYILYAPDNTEQDFYEAIDTRMQCPRCHLIILDGEEHECIATDFDDEAPQRNPLVITEYMKQWRIDEKVHCVIIMPAKAFLDLTTSPGCIDDIKRSARSLEQYNTYATQHPTKMMPIFLNIRPDGPADSWGTITSHEGRHRVQAMLNNGEALIEVSLRIETSPSLPSSSGQRRDWGGALWRSKTILDLPRYWRNQFGTNYVFNAENIAEVLECNVQETYQKPPIIANGPMDHDTLMAILPD